jgi:hypothetical protein
MKVPFRNIKKNVIIRLKLAKKEKLRNKLPKTASKA